MENDTDENLVAQVAAGDRRSFRCLMERHMPLAIRVAQRVTGNTADADDIAQEAFLRVWTRAGSFDPARARFTTWLYRIVTNLAIDQRRRPLHADIDAAAEVADGGPGPLSQIEAREQRRAVDAAIASLPARQRAAVVLFHMEGLSGREAAAVLELSEKAFESLLIRGRAAVKAACRARDETVGGARDAR
ncbi:RNA polymerase sigma factor [Rhodoplanes sp. TEM]|uniref:RNA polymerase sigma factor n=1 Tax=Rhodoplanes tepidamans TaxID=200616 RepID=A0ABT5J9D7_RHOTP|nr:MULTISPECIES: RNA polymerase sigma factor [Rhodoplanes]MDC7786224.1 RNA polymerase sigma factor [Rhodoplanes tepidamans]MDC7982405.1 RNA polymerase sigma factor [Rhodoplanes sp. TEM]MDQ0355023.1 RNA polymerase sigma-70 factor (ECF subfamily) [Rhodoplanes tepidamans]